MVHRDHRAGREHGGAPQGVTGSRTGEGGGPGARRGVPKIRSLRGDVIGGASPETSGSAGNLA
ncbi:hypothetical protein AMK24_09655 [Streptomyces sp. CB02366]|nr:hypothetical protein AMK24_09655 [Streptomyces sp. CB02366]